MDADQRAQRRETWTTHVDDWRRSGLSMAAYCRERQLAYWQFLYWRRALAEETAEAPSISGFVALQSEPDGEDCGIIVRLSEGHLELRLARGFDVQELARAVTALGAHRC